MAASGFPPIGSGSGYGTSSGVICVIIDGSTVISPPPRSESTNTSLSSGPPTVPASRLSSRCALMDIVRPFAKNANSARAGAAYSASGTAHASQRPYPRADEELARRFSTRTILPWVHEGMEHADAKLPRILAVRARHEGRNVGLVDHDAHFCIVAGSEAIGLQRNLLQLLLAGLKRELVQRLTVQGELHAPRLTDDRRGVIDVEIEDAVFFGILEREGRLFLGPLPLNRLVMLDDFGRVPPVFEDGRKILGLRLKLDASHLVRPLSDVFAVERQALLIARRIEADLERGLAHVGIHRHEDRPRVVDRLSRLPLPGGDRRVVVVGPNHLFVGVYDVEHHAIVFVELCVARYDELVRNIERAAERGPVVVDCDARRGDGRGVRFFAFTRSHAEEHAGDSRNRSDMLHVASDSTTVVASPAIC